jgi:hypothetical protein
VERDANARPLAQFAATDQPNLAKVDELSSDRRENLPTSLGRWWPNCDKSATRYDNEETQAQHDMRGLASFFVRSK